MKRFLPLLVSLAMLLPLCACGGTAESGPSATAPASAPPMETPAESQEAEAPTETPTAEAPADNNETPEDDKMILIAYFSATNTTEGIADHLGTILDADLYEIVPETPYTTADLDWHDDSSRTTLEMNDPDARPAISGSVENMENYDIIFLGYPIWWGEAPRIVSTFLESYDLSGKTIVPFCTSGSSGIGSSATNLHDLAENATWLDGHRFSGGASEADVRAWVDSLPLAS